MHIDRELRRKLSQELRRLVTGRMTNNEFDEVWYHCLESTDEAVREIAGFGFGLYSSDVLLPYRLKGVHRVDDATRRTVARCVLFLRSNLPYEWPSFSVTSAAESVTRFAAHLCVPSGLILLAVGLPYLAFDSRDTVFWWCEVLVGTALCLGGAAHVLRMSRLRSDRSRQWRLNGDFDVWPFLRREQFYASRRRDFLPES